MNHQLQKIFLAFILALIQAIPITYAAEAIAGIKVELSMDQQEYSATDELKLNVTLTNTTDEAITFLKWETPFENDFTGDMLTVKYEGQSVQYIGKMVKRIAPTEDDYQVVESGETIVASIDISEGYAIEQGGDYTIVFNKHLQIVDNSVAKRLSDEVAFKSAELSSPVMNFTLAEKRNVKQRAKQANFSSCSAGQQTTLNNAQAAAITIALESRDILNNTATSDRATAERYTTWFGRFTTDRYSTVTNHFTKIHDALANQQVGFLCDCNENFFAYVFVGDEYNIHLCNAFWNADLNGTDSQAGTLVHEVSHFTVVSSTDDHAYGQRAAKGLAINNPIKAVDNADNHEYFAENTPKLPMTIEVAKADDFEVNNTQITAKEITSDNEQAHSIFPVGDQDWSKFTLNATSNVILTTSGGEGDTQLFLLDSNGDVISSNDNISSSNTFSQIRQSALVAGIYFVRVEEKDNNTEIAKYTLTFSIPPTFEENGGNNTLGSAASISPASTQSFLSLTVGDIDWFKFRLTEESIVKLNIVAASISDDILLSLRDSTGVEITQKNSASKISTRFLKETQSTLVAGEYFLKIEERDNDQAINDYDLSIESTPVNKSEANGSSGGGGGYLSIELLSLLILLGFFKMRRRYVIK